MRTSAFSTTGERLQIEFTDRGVMPICDSSGTVIGAQYVSEFIINGERHIHGVDVRRAAKVLSVPQMRETLDNAFMASLGVDIMTMEL